MSMTFDELKKSELPDDPAVRDAVRPLQQAAARIEQLQIRLDGELDALLLASTDPEERRRLREERRNLPHDLFDTKAAIPSLRAAFVEAKLEAQAKAAPILWATFEQRLDKLEPLLAQMVAVLDELEEVLVIDSKWSVAGSSYNSVKALPSSIGEAIGRLRTACRLWIDQVLKNSRREPAAVE
jgi:hypothetical protein